MEAITPIPCLISSSSPPSSAASSRSLDGEDAFSSLGAERVLTAASMRQSLALLDDEDIDVAALD